MIEEFPSEQFSSRIENISHDKLTIAMPMTKGHPVQLNRGERFFGKVFFDGAAYEFQTTLLEKQIFPLPVWIVSMPTAVRRIQQRAFVRVDSIVPIKIKVLDNNGDDTQLISTTTKDISGGGLRLVSKKYFKLGTQFQLYIELPEFGTIETLAEVVRVDKPDDSRSLYWIGIKYINLQEGLRSKIIKFVFKKQLEYRQKGL